MCVCTQWTSTWSADSIWYCKDSAWQAPAEMKVFIRQEDPAYQSTEEMPTGPSEGMVVTCILCNSITL